MNPITLIHNLVNMKKEVTTLEQSKRLKELGVVQKSRLGWIIPPSNGMGGVNSMGHDNGAELISANIVLFGGNGEDKWCAYTATELMALLPDSIEDKENNEYPLLGFYKTSRKTWLGQYDNYGNENNSNRDFYSHEGESITQVLADIAIQLFTDHPELIPEANERLLNYLKD